MKTLQILKDTNSPIKNPYRSLYFALALCMSSFYFGYTLVYLSAVDFSTIADIYRINFDIHFAQGLFQGVLPIGGAMGAMLSTPLLSVFSRRSIVHWFSLSAGILSLLSLIPDYRVFLLVRLLQGITAGLFTSVTPMIVKEVTPLKMVSLTGSLPNLMIILGLFWLYTFGFVLGLISGQTTGATYWQYIFLFPILLLSIQSFILQRWFPYQTPKYWAQRMQNEQVHKMLSDFYKQQSVQQIYQQTLKHNQPDSQEADKKNTNYQSKTALIYGVFYAVLCTMVGINVVLSYSTQIAASVFPSLKPAIGAIMMFLFLLFSTISIEYVARFGRKQLTLWGTYGIAATLYGISIGYVIAEYSAELAQVVIFVCLVLYLFAYGMTYAPLMWMFVAEALKPSQVGYAVTANWSGAALIMIIFPIAKEMLASQAYIFLFFGLCASGSVLVTNRLMVQTKDKKQHQIQAQYKQLDKLLWGNPEEVDEIQLELIKK